MQMALEIAEKQSGSIKRFLVTLKATLSAFAVLLSSASVDQAGFPV
jgi:hypothetical protein